MELLNNGIPEEWEGFVGDVTRLEICHKNSNRLMRGMQFAGKCDRVETKIQGEICF